MLDLKALLIGVAVGCGAASLHAQPVVHLRGASADLPKGTHVRIVSTVEYRIYELPKYSGTADVPLRGDAVRYRVAARQAFRWEFDATGGRLVAPPVAIRFDAPLPPVPPHSLGVLAFPTTYDVDMTIGTERRPIHGANTYTSHATLSQKIDRCIEISGAGAGKFRVGVSQTCFAAR